MSDNLCVLKFILDGNSIHRHRCDASKTKYKNVVATVTELYNVTGFQIAYHDDEKELITISNDAELAEAFLCHSNTPDNSNKALRLFITGGNELTPSKVKQNAAARAFQNRHVAQPTTGTKAPPANAAALAFKNRHVSKPKTDTKASSKAAKTKAPPKPSKPVPLAVTSGGAKLFLDGTVEFGLGGDAVLQKDGTVRCIMNGNGFPSVKAQGLSVRSGKWYYEIHLLTGGCMQVGWVTPDYTGDATQGNGVGDDELSYAYDGYRQLRWHKSQETPWGKKWKAGDTVCCTVDCERGELRYTLNGQWPSYADSVCFNGVPVQDVGGLTPAVSFSNGEKCRFNFGADGTPLAYGPPDPSFLPVWNAYGTVHNVASTPMGRRGSGHSMPSMPHGESKQQPRTGRCPEKEDPHLQLLQLISRDSVRASISKALSHPLVAASVQDMMEGIVMNGMMQKGPEQAAALEQTFKTQCAKLLPVGMTLVAEHPELISVATTLMHVLKDHNVVGGASCTGSASFHHRHHHRHRKGRCGGADTTGAKVGAKASAKASAKGDTANGRANRDPNWRQHVEQVLGNPDLIGEHIRRWSGKIVETASTVANQVHEAATGAQAREQLNADNLKKAIDESTKAAQSMDEAALSRAVANSLSETEELPKEVPEEVSVEEEGETKEHVSEHPPTTPVPAQVVAVVHKPKAKFMKDGNGGRHTDMSPGQLFQHTWRLMNNGSSAWSEHVTVRCVGGDAMKGSEHSVVVPAGIAPNQAYDATIELIAPEMEGRYICYFRLHDGDARFGDRIWIDLTVRAAASKEKKEVSEGDAAPAVPAAPAPATDGGKTAVASEEGVLPVFSDEDEDALLNAAVDESLKPSSSLDDLTDWDMVSDSMRAAAAEHAAAGVVDAPDPSVTKEESQGETKTDINAVEPAPPAYVDVANVPEVAAEVPEVVANEEMTDERIKNQLEKLVELGFSEKAAATALVQCNGDLGGAVTLLLASSGRLG